MTNFHDPKVVQADGGLSSMPLHFPAAVLTFFPRSRFHEGPLCSGGSLHVSFASEYFRSKSATTKDRWEFFTSLWFEWQIITGKRSYRWSIWVRASRPRSDLLLSFLQLYSGCRFSALFAIITIFIGFNVTTPINCRVRDAPFFFSFRFS
jgi:hypothetical protein